MAKWQHDLIKNYERLLVSDDDLIDQYDCIKCGGACCYNNDVLINPYDVWRIVHDERVADLLGIQTTHDLFTPGEVSYRLSGRKEPLLRYYLGPESRLPVAFINMVSLDKDITVCPFNQPVLEVKTKADLNKIKQGKFNELKFLTAGDGRPSGLCVLEYAKPTICRSYPLGRMGISNSPGEFPKMQYIRLKNKRCEEFKIPGKAMTVREYVKKWDLDYSYRMSDLVIDWYEKLQAKVKDEKKRVIIGSIFFNFDLPRLGQIAEEGNLDKEAFQKARQSRPESFEELLLKIQMITDRIAD